MVEWKKLGEVCKVLRGKRLTKSQLSETEGYPVLHGGSTPMGYYSDFNRKANTTVVVNTGNAGCVFFYDKEFWSSDACFSLYPNESIIDKFLYLYVYGCERILKGKIRAGAMPTIDANAVESLLIPVPSIKEQQHIVDFLDAFTSSIDNLKGQIDLRRKQYEHYRDQLLDLDGKDGVEMKTLGEVCDKTGNIKWKNENDDACYSYIDLSSVSIETHMIGNVSIIKKSNAPSRAQQIVKEGDVLLGTTRPTLKRFCMVTKEFDNQICSTGFCVFRANRVEVSEKWIYHIIGCNRFWDYCEVKQQGAGYPCLSNTDAFHYSIPVPSLAEQQRIVSILDTFEQSIANLEQQLAQREKQYEYYRNKLLKFD